MTGIEGNASSRTSAFIEFFARGLQSAFTRALHVWRPLSWLAVKVRDNGFGFGLCILFALSLVPFLLSPSFLLTFALSLPPFVLVAWQARSELRYIEVDMRNELNCLDSFVTNAEPYWTRLKNSPGATISEDDILALAPEGIRKPAEHSKSLIEDIAKGKLYLIDASSESILRPYRDDFEARYRDASGYSNLSIKVGILGTFFGFILALNNLSSLFANLTQEHPEIVVVTLQNLAYAFVKSLFGLAFSILIIIRVSKLRRPLNTFYRRFDQALSFGREFVNRMTLADPAIQTSLVQVRNSLKQLEQRLFDHSGSVAHALREHGELINEQTKTFSLAAQGMVDVQKNWVDAFANLNEAANAFERRTSGAVSQIREGLDTAGSKFQETLKLFDSTREDLAQTKESVLETVRQSEQGWTIRFDSLMSQTDSQNKKFEQWVGIADNAFETVQRQMSVIENNFAHTSEQFDNAIGVNRNLVLAIQQLDETVRQRVSEFGAGIVLRARASGVSRLLQLLAIIVLGGAVYFYWFDDPWNVRGQLDQLIRRILGSVSGA